ncbi:hypothetical protein MTO96_049080 [Rhipicephalus appendiculatus]
MTPSHLARLRPVVSLLCLAVLIALTTPAESVGKPYLLIQHQVYEEHQEVLGKGPSNRSAAAYRKNDEEELFDFIKDYLFKRGGAQKLNSRSSNGRAQFVGVDSGGANGSAASGGAVKDSGQSGQRYKMHIIKFRLVNASHPAIAATRNAQEHHNHKEHHTNGGGESHEEHHTNGGGESHKEHHTNGGGESHEEHHTNGGGESHKEHHTNGGGESRKEHHKNGGGESHEEHHKNGGGESHKEHHTNGGGESHEEHHTNGGGESHNQGYLGNLTLPSRHWIGRYRTSHPTHVTTAHTEPPPALPRRAAAAAAVGNCELPETTKRTTKRTTTITTTTRHTTTTTRRTTTTTTTPKPTTTTKRTTTCAPTTVTAVGCERAPPPPTTRMTTRARRTTTTEAPQVYLHGHPYVVIKLHEVKGTRRVPSKHFSPLPPYLRFLLANGTYPNRNAADTEQLSEYARTPSILAARRLARSERRNEWRRLALKREVAGNLMRVLRTIRELDSMAEQDQQDGQQLEEVQDLQLQPEMPQQQAAYELVAPDTAAEIDQLLRHRDRSQRFRSQDRWAAEYPDELKENRAEEGDLHQFSILLKKALDELSVQPDAKGRTTPKPHKAAAAAVYR